MAAWSQAERFIWNSSLLGHLILGHRFEMLRTLVEKRSFFGFELVESRGDAHFGPVGGDIVLAAREKKRVSV